MMATIDLNHVLNQIKEEAKIAPPGILSKRKTIQLRSDLSKTQIANFILDLLK